MDIILFTRRCTNNYAVFVCVFTKRQLDIIFILYLLSVMERVRPFFFLIFFFTNRSCCYTHTLVDQTHVNVKNKNTEIRRKKARKNSLWLCSLDIGIQRARVRLQTLFFASKRKVCERISTDCILLSKTRFYASFANGRRSTIPRKNFGRSTSAKV